MDETEIKADIGRVSLELDIIVVLLFLFYRFLCLPLFALLALLVVEGEIVFFSVILLCRGCGCGFAVVVIFSCSFWYVFLS